MSIETRALRSGRRQTGEFQSNRQSRWRLNPADPQYGSEEDCKVILIILFAQLLLFRNAPRLNDPVVVQILERDYLNHPIEVGSYRDALLLDHLDYQSFLDEIENPRHGHSEFHIGHQDPTLVPKHTPGNIYWRTYRSNLIQGNMTLRQARIYMLKLIGRYFELGELEIN
ncbi:hypothetical protein [Burkholderia pseudomallei]|uniref:hypothetical protein n=1 Tax=Burkholderia pseudomallei TaxID=28450 RepID=UPI001178959E|nr:hypothetical protein [Burkholderia pseudomallei]